jgi:hypothetical protein
VPFLKNGNHGDVERFFPEYDALRYEKEGHILDALDHFGWKGKRVLEIGIRRRADRQSRHGLQVILVLTWGEVIWTV